MLDKASEGNFIRIGLERYPDARETVDYFETAVMQAIFSAFEGKGDWKHFQPARDPMGGLYSGKAIGPVDRYIHAFIKGGVPARNGRNEAIWLSLGVYWNPARRPSAKVVASSTSWVEAGGPTLPLLDVTTRDRRVFIGQVNRRDRPRMVVELDEGLELSEAFGLLLDSLDNALAASV